MVSRAAASYLGSFWQKSVEATSSLVERAKGIWGKRDALYSTQVSLMGKSINPFSAGGNPQVRESTARAAAGVLTGIVEGLQVELARTPVPPASLPPSPAPVKPPPLELSLARPPVRIYEETNWERKFGNNVELMSQKLSQFGLLWYMSHLSGIKSRDNNAQLLDLVHEASSAKPPSLWILFTERYQIRWTQLSWWKAGFVYFFGYSLTSLIPNVTRSYLKGVLNGIRREFSENPRNLGPLLRTGLENGEAFLSDLDRAAHRFATTPGAAFETCLLEEIQARYQGDLPALCRRFAQALIDRYPIRVAFFKDALASRFPFKWIEGWINKVVRYLMKERILPSVLHSAVSGSFDAANTLSFKTNLVNFIKDQFVQFGANGSKPTRPLQHLEGTERLPRIARHLIGTASLMSGTENAASMRRLLEERNERERLRPEESIDTQIDKGISDEVSDSAHRLFHYLTDRSPEILGRLSTLSLTLLARGGKVYTPGDYEIAQKSMKEEARKVFSMIIPPVVHKKMEGEKDPARTAQAFEERKIEAEQTLFSLKTLFKSISRSVTEQRQSNIQSELGAAAQIIRRFAEWRPPEILSDLEKASLESAFGSIDKEIDSSIKKISLLHTKAHAHTFHKAVGDSLQGIRDLLSDFHLNPQIEEIRNYRRMISMTVRPNRSPRIPLEVREIDEGLSILSSSTEPFRVIRSLLLELDGLSHPLDALKTALSSGKSPKRLHLDPIRLVLKQMQELGQERAAKTLLDAIDNFIKQRNTASWNDLQHTMQEIRDRYGSFQQKQIRKMRDAAASFRSRVEELLAAHRELQSDHLRNIDLVLADSQGFLGSLQNHLKSLKPGPEAVEVSPSVAGAALGGATGMVYGAPLAALIGAGSYVATHQLEGLKKRSWPAMLAVGTSAIAAAGVAAISSPPALIVAAAALTSAAAERAKPGVKQFGENMVTTRVTELFDQICMLALQPGTLHAVATRSMSAFI